MKTNSGEGIVGSASSGLRVHDGGDRRGCDGFKGSAWDPDRCLDSIGTLTAQL